MTTEAPPLVTAEEIEKRVAAGDRLMSAHEIAYLMGGDTSAEWIRRNWPGRVDLGDGRRNRSKKLRWWRSEVVKRLAEAQQK